MNEFQMQQWLAELQIKISKTTGLNCPWGSQQTQFKHKNSNFSKTGTRFQT
jgi:hypothetical protein